MDELTFYFDRNFGKRLPNALSKLRPPVGIRWHQGERFAQDMPDDEWMAKVGERQWVVLSQDIKFHKIKHEIEAIRQHSLRCFYFPDGQVGMWKMLQIFMRSNEKVIRKAQTEQGPFVYSVQKSGALKQIYSDVD